MIARPKFINVPLADGLHWRAGAGWIYQQKMDGRWHVLTVGGETVVGELMRDGRFYGFDLVRHQGQDISREPLRFRIEALNATIRKQPTILPVPTGSGGEFLEAVLSAGGEGIVAKRLDAPFGATWWRCKRRETFDCRVAEFHPRKQSVRLELDGADAGWLGTRGNNLTVGSVVEVACHSIHPSGKLREPWLVRPRPDK